MDPRVSLDGCGKSCPHRIRYLDRPARSESLYGLRCPGPWFYLCGTYIRLCRGMVINRLQFFTPSKVGLIHASETNACTFSFFIRASSYQSCKPITSHRNALELGLLGVSRLSVVVLPLYETTTRVCHGLVRSDPANLQVGEWRRS